MNTRVILLLCAVACSVLLPLSVHAQSRLFTFRGDSPADEFGWSVRDAGDVDGDGHADVIVGAPGRYSSGGGIARVLSGKNGTVLYTFRGDSPGDAFGASVSGAGDVNQDGRADLIVGAFHHGRYGGGYARVFSGKSGTTLYTVHGTSAGDAFGASVSGAGDVNLDGHADFIIGAPNDDIKTPNSGSAWVFSGKDGALLFLFIGDSAGDGFGSSVAGAGDVNLDGLADLIVGAQYDDDSGQDSGSARVFSGKDGTTLFTVYGTSAGHRFGRPVSGGCDVNQDGHADLIVGAPYDDKKGLRTGSARVLSGRDGVPLFTVYGDSAGDFFGYSVSSAGDVNGDRHPDLVAGAPDDDDNGTSSGSARVFSGKDGTPLFTLAGDGAGDLLGWSVSGGGDVNLDGIPDIIAGARQQSSATGYARVLSGTGLSLATDTHRLSVARAGVQTLFLDAGGAHAGKPYLLLGTLADTRPGFQVGSFTVPLNPDGYFFFTFFSPNAPPLSGSSGILDNGGRSTAVFTVIPGLFGSLVGLTAHHAFGVLGSGSLDLVSNPAPLTLMP